MAYLSKTEQFSIEPAFFSSLHFPAVCCASTWMHTTHVSSKCLASLKIFVTDNTMELRKPTSWIGSCLLDRTALHPRHGWHWFFFELLDALISFNRSRFLPAICCWYINRIAAAITALTIFIKIILGLVVLILILIFCLFWTFFQIKSSLLKTFSFYLVLRDWLTKWK